MVEIKITSRGPARILRGPGDLRLTTSVSRAGTSALAGSIRGVVRLSEEAQREREAIAREREKEQEEFRRRKVQAHLGDVTGEFAEVFDLISQTDFRDQESVERLDDAIEQAELRIDEPGFDDEQTNERVRDQGARMAALFDVSAARLRRDARNSQFQNIENNDRQVLHLNVTMQNLETTLDSSIGTLERLREFGDPGLRSDEQFDQAVAAETRALHLRAWENFRTDPATREQALLFAASGMLRKFQTVSPEATVKSENLAIAELRGRAELTERTLKNELLAVGFTSARLAINTYNKKLDDDFAAGLIPTKEQRDFRKSAFALQAKKQAAANRTAGAKRTPEEKADIDELKAMLDRDINETARILDVSAEEKLFIAGGVISREDIHGAKQRVVDEAHLNIITRMREANELFSRNGKPPIYSEQAIQIQDDKFADMSFELIRDKNAFNEGKLVYYSKSLKSGGTFAVEQVKTFVDDLVIPGYRLAISQIGTGEITSRSVGQMMLNDRERSGYPNQTIRNFHKALWEGEHVPSWRAVAEFYRKARRRGLTTQFSVGMETELDVYLVLESSEPGPLLAGDPSGELRGPVSDDLASQLRLRARQIIQERKGGELSPGDERALDERFDDDFDEWPPQARSDFKTLVRKYETARSSNPEDLAANALNNVWSENSFTGQVMRNNPEKIFGTGIMSQFEREMESLGLISERKISPTLPEEGIPDLLGPPELPEEPAPRLELGQMIMKKDGKTRVWPVIDADTGLQIVVPGVGEISWVPEPEQTSDQLNAMRVVGDLELQNMKRVLATEAGRGSFESLPPELQQRYIHRGLLSERVPLFDQALALEAQMKALDVKLGNAPGRGEPVGTLMPPASRAESGRYIDGIGYLSAPPRAARKIPDFEFREVEFKDAQGKLVKELRIFKGK